MSSPVHHPEDLDAALRYAPPWARNTAGGASPGDPGAESPPTIPSDDDGEPPFDGDRAMLDLQHRLSLDPNQLPEPPVRINDRPTLDRIALRLCAVAGLAAFVAWLTISLPINISLPISMSLPFKSHIDGIVHAAMSSAITATPIKVLHIHTPVAPLAVAAAPSVAPAPVPVRLAEATPQVTQEPTRATQGPPESVPAADPPPAAKTETLAPDEIAMLVKRGKDLLATGDVASARLLLRRAAEAGDAEAALAFGSTFDPAVIARLGAIGVEADSARARKWYEKAAALGSNLASDKIAKLAEAGR
jgi:hypothetical protein